MNILSELKINDDEDDSKEYSLYLKILRSEVGLNFISLTGVHLLGENDKAKHLYSQTKVNEIRFTSSGEIVIPIYSNVELKHLFDIHILRNNTHIFKNIGCSVLFNNNVLNQINLLVQCILSEDFYEKIAKLYLRQSLNLDKH